MANDYLTTKTQRAQRTAGTAGSLGTTRLHVAQRLQPVAGFAIQRAFRRARTLELAARRGPFTIAGLDEQLQLAALAPQLVGLLRGNVSGLGRIRRAVVERVAGAPLLQLRH